MIPFAAALSIATTALFKLSFARFLSPAATAASTFFTRVLSLDFTILFLKVFVSMTLILFFADLMLANLYTSKPYDIDDEHGPDPDTDVPIHTYSDMIIQKPCGVNRIFDDYLPKKQAIWYHLSCKTEKGSEEAVPCKTENYQGSGKHEDLL